MTKSVKENANIRRLANQKVHNEFMKDTYNKVMSFDYTNIPSESDNFAVIIEPRPHPSLEYVIRNVMHFLGDGWGLYIVGSPANKDFLLDILKGWQNVTIELLQQDNLSRHEFRSMRKSANYWRKLKGKKLLCFEVDTLLCKPGILEFIGYDYIGAPWSLPQSVSDVVRVGNGGLSIRSKQAMIEMCQRGKTHTIPSEDSYFSIQLHLHKDEYILPSVETAMKFSVETLYYPTPLGLHKPWVYLSRSEILTIYGNINYDLN